MSPSSRPAAHANLLRAEEAAYTHDEQARGDGYHVLKREKALQQKVTSTRLRQAPAVEAQVPVDM